MARHSHPFLDPCFHVIYVLYKFCCDPLNSPVPSANMPESSGRRSLQVSLACRVMAAVMGWIYSCRSSLWKSTRPWQPDTVPSCENEQSCGPCCGREMLHVFHVQPTNNYWGRWYYSTWHSEVLRDWNHGLRLKGSLWLVTESLCGNEQHRYLQI